MYDKIIICEGNGGIRDDYMYQCQEFIIGDLYPEGQVPHKFRWFTARLNLSTVCCKTSVKGFRKGEKFGQGSSSVSIRLQGFSGLESS